MNLTPGGIELPNRLEESPSFRCDELAEIQPVALVLLHVGDDEAEVRRDEPLGSLLVPLLRQPRETTLLGGITDQGKLLDVLEVLVERG